MVKSNAILDGVSGTSGQFDMPHAANERISLATFAQKMVWYFCLVVKFQNCRCEPFWECSHQNSPHFKSTMGQFLLCSFLFSFHAWRSWRSCGNVVTKCDTPVIILSALNSQQRLIDGWVTELFCWLCRVRYDLGTKCGARSLQFTHTHTHTEARAQTGVHVWENSRVVGLNFLSEHGTTTPISKSRDMMSTVLVSSALCQWYSNVFSVLSSQPRQALLTCGMQQVHVHETLDLTWKAMRRSAIWLHVTSLSENCRKTNCLRDSTTPTDSCRNHFGDNVFDKNLSCQCFWTSPRKLILRVQWSILPTKLFCQLWYVKNKTRNLCWMKNSHPGPREKKPKQDN